MPQRPCPGACCKPPGLEALAERSGGVPLGTIPAGRARPELRLGLPAGMAVSRARFDAELVGAAIEAGVQFLPRTEARVGAVEGAARLVRLGRGRGADRPRQASSWSPRGSAARACPPARAPRSRVARGSRIGTGCLLDDGPADYGAGTIHMAVGGPATSAWSASATAACTSPVRSSPGPCATPAGRAPRRRAILARRASRRSPGSGSARWRGTPALTRRTRPLADDRAVRPGGRRRICRALHRRGDRLGPGVGPGDRTPGPPGHRAMGASARPASGSASTAASSAVDRSLCRAAAAVLRRPVARPGGLRGHRPTAPARAADSSTI